MIVITRLDNITRSPVVPSCFRRPTRPEVESSIASNRSHWIDRGGATAPLAPSRGPEPIYRSAGIEPLEPARLG